MPEGKELGDVVKEIADGIGPTITVDTTGVPALINAGVQFTRNRGKIVQVGTTPFDFKLEIDMFSFMLSGKQLLGAIEGQAYPPEYVPKMIQWYREGKFPFDKLMKLIPADDFEQGLKESKYTHEQKGDLNYMPATWSLTHQSYSHTLELFANSLAY